MIADFSKHFLIMSLLCIFTICLFNNAFAEDKDNKLWQNYFLGKVINHDTPKSDQIFKFQFRVVNGTIDKLTQASEWEGITADVHSQGNTTLEIKFPRNYPFVQGYNDASEHYTPLIYFSTNHIEGNYTMSTSDCFFVYSVPFSGTSTIDMLIAHSLISNLPDMYHGDNISPSCNNSTIVSYMPPLQQIKSGLDPKMVACQPSLQLLIKAEDKSLACVYPMMFKILVERGWGVSAS
ncbi:MAG: hypothetical protein ACREAD_08755 [Nitrosopumilaceae archaeon]